MLFQDLLRLHDIPEQDVALCLHKPADPIVRRAVRVLAQERPDLFEAYQSTHAPQPEATVRARGFMASFIATSDGEVTFAGLFRREIGPILSLDDWLGDDVRREMLQRVDGHRSDLVQVALGLVGRALFALSRVDRFASLEKRLICHDPGGRAYMRLAETTPLEVLELSRVDRISPPMPEWTELSLSCEEIRQLPAEWAVALRNWRGIYLIVDERDGQRYVGSAYGQENLLGRWRNHVARDRGVTRDLQSRDPATFRFSVLELLAPTAVVEDVVARENSWKLRLDTRRHGFNGN
ncbi:GIY-YIG nuclease family protein [Pseudooceanicola nitratireducens]|uniref:GIY-YIG nuclease family protein n=1 Tax=Pseudooceanicola nitratireducens TaxID=517719 RepID=UPI001C9642B1|nr:GIY-YIG nuclease family protein [Pseudooceanicola nitratireducens]MBY6166832.1 GIY-YIG nuclease family protein [Pseudooceanicola nitratireducens]